MDILHYRKENTRFGDAFPLWANGVYHLYYLRLNEADNVIVWAHLSSPDLICWTEHPNVLEPLGKGSEEIALMTGCVFYENGVFHAFYSALGADGVFRMKKALSSDGIVFHRQDRVLFENDSRYADEGTWRDPCVVKSEEDGLYHMYFCAKRPIAEGDVFAGVLGHAVSPDLEVWKLEPPAYDGGIATTVECPDFIKKDQTPLLVYYWHETRVRVWDGEKWGRVGSLSPTGFDFMAGKTLTANGRVLLFGWIPEKTCDCCERVWGGNLAIPRELFLENGEPCCRFVDEIYSLFDRRCMKLNTDNLLFARGSWEKTGNTLSANAIREGAIAYVKEAENNYYFSCEITVKDGCGTFGFLVRTEKDAGRKHPTPTDSGYLVCFELFERRVSVREHYVWDQRPDLAGAYAEIKKGEPFLLEMFIHKDVLEIGLNKRKTLSFRMKKHVETGAFAIYAQDCEVEFGDIVTKIRE